MSDLQNSSPKQTGLWIALTGMVIALAAIATLVAAAMGTREGWWHFSAGLLYAEWAVYGAALAFVVSLIGLFISRSRGARRAIVPGVVGLVASGLILTMAAQWEYAARVYPSINDITTDTEDPPYFWDVPNPMDYPGEDVAALQLAGYPDIVPLTLTAPAETVFAEALAIITARGWEIAGEAEDEGRIEAIADSALFGFSDEVIVRITETDSGVLVDMRSRSRVGKIDRGVNAARIRSFLAELKKRVESNGS